MTAPSPPIRPPTLDPVTAGARLMARCDALAALTEEPGRVTRTYLTPRHAEANALVGRWMTEAGMAVSEDALGNVIGRLEGRDPGAASVMIGSHLDTVRDAGRYDGILGVLTGIEAVEAWHRSGQRPPFALEVVGFGDEEGVRFGATLIGSRGVAGTLEPEVLDRRDGQGMALREALAAFGLDPAAWATACRAAAPPRAYLEVHIEQGPVLEDRGLPLGLVTAVAGGTRWQVTLTGQAGHAGTVPMTLRKDALAGAAEAVLAVEAVGLAHPVVATVGRLEARPGAVNVIAGEAGFSVDLRAADDRDRAVALADLRSRLEAIADRRGLSCRVTLLHESPAVPCSPRLMARVEAALRARGLAAERLLSGAGHDAAALAAITDVAMLFVRCAGGISHNPLESITAEDAGLGAAVLLDTLVSLTEDPHP